MSVGVAEIQAISVTVRLDSEEPSSSSQKLTSKEDGECSSQVNCVVHQPETRSTTIQSLEPETQFCLRAVAFNEEGDLDESELEFSTLKDDNGDEAGKRQHLLLTNSSNGLCSNPSVLEDESNNVLTSCCKENGDNDNTEVESELEDERLVKRKVNEIEGRDDVLITPCRRDTYTGKQEGNKSSKSRTSTVNRKPETNVLKGVGGDKDLGYIVRTIRCLEQEGHIDKNFRKRFLTWYSFRATQREAIVVKLFVETFTDDPSSLGQQLMHTFSECILSKRSSTTGGVVPSGICLKLWH